MVEGKSELTLEEALSIPLLREDPKSGQEKLLVKNLKTRFDCEITNYLYQQSETHKQRKLLNIERCDSYSVYGFREIVKKVIDKINGDDVAVKTITRMEFRALAQYLSWSFFQATEHIVEDIKYLPGSKALNDVRQLFFNAKKASERK